MKGLHLLTLVFLCLGFTSTANAFFTTNPNLVKQCDSDRQYIVKGFWGGASPTYGLCDDCGTATQTDKTTTPNSVTYTYQCDHDSGNYVCEETEGFNEDPRTDAQKNSGEWNQSCLWGMTSSDEPYYRVTYYRTCRSGYSQETRSCKTETLLASSLQQRSDVSALPQRLSSGRVL